MVFSAALTAALMIAAPASAQDLTGSQEADQPGAWYVVGDIGAQGAQVGSPVDGFAGFDDRLVAGDEEQRRVALGLTFSNAAADRALSFTAPSPSVDPNSEDRFTFLVSGAYDWHTGTVVTPRFMAGVGISYLDPDAAPTRLRQDGSEGGTVAPAMQVGIGADVAVSSSLDLSAEYRASVRGGAEAGRTEYEPQVDQKFMIGAKIRF